MKWFRLGVWEETKTSSQQADGRLVIISVALLAFTVLGVRDAGAVPSYARQTGLACSSCHTVFLELTAFGRAFKMHGYTTQAMKEQLEEAGTDKEAPLNINRTFPLSVMLQTSLTRTDAQQPGTQNANVEFPQQLSIFLAGEITPHIGTFLQVTYTGQDDNFSLDNTDIRYADDTTIGDRELIYGVSLNNNPTVEDLWHSTPAWAFPFASADSAPTPAASALVDGALAQQVAGLGGYFLWNKHLYANVTLYRSAQIGAPQPPTTTSNGTIRDVAPYWRVAWQQTSGPNYIEVGTFGLFAQVIPTGTSGATNKFTDFAFDAQYERALGTNSLSAHATYIYENQQLDATHAAGGSSNESDKLHTVRLDGIYHYQNQVALSLGYFLTHGTSDPILYAPAAISGSANGSPDSDGVLAEIAYFPWQNVRLSAMYTVYTEFNGRANNYDGSSRDAFDNNTLYVLLWLMY
ncbi:MAG: cytochrome C [Deltaproteobacteria bacterium]|nr:cytochrome C [Deltaproteobacteria bacterium]MBI3390146.1 cytochrome C [Deltaproteobacteria bacterium]